MPDHVLQGRSPVVLTLRRSGRARRITLRVSQLDGRVTLTLPRGVSETEALAFANEKQDWIRNHLDRRAAPVRVEIGSELPIAGVSRRIVSGTGRAIVLHPDHIAVPGPADQIASRLSGWMKARARADLAMAADRHAARLGRNFTGLTLRDTRSRWGSCSSAGRLMFSWRLYMAPPEVMDYVAAHEVAHLAEMNHSPAFWAVVHDLYGPYARQRNWLRSEGAALHRYRFGD